MQLARSLTPLLALLVTACATDPLAIPSDGGVLTSSQVATDGRYGFCSDGILEPNDTPEHALDVTASFVPTSDGARLRLGGLSLCPLSDAFQDFDVYTFAGGAPSFLRARVSQPFPDGVLMIGLRDGDAGDFTLSPDCLELPLTQERAYVMVFSGGTGASQLPYELELERASTILRCAR